MLTPSSYIRASKPSAIGLKSKSIEFININNILNPIAILLGSLLNIDYAVCE
jgi:hypothetical protein